MQRKITLSVIAVLLALACTNDSQVASSEITKKNLVGNHKSSSTTQKKKQITIRNVTKDTIQYTIKAIYSQEKPLEMTIKPGSIDRFSKSTPMDIVFKSYGKTIKYRLDPGTPYSFRYTENARLGLYKGSHGRPDATDLAPYVPTPGIVVDKMLEMAEVDKDDILYDLGCGDGRIVIKAAKKYGTRGVGIDIDPDKIKESKATARMVGVENLVEFRVEDVMKANFSEATVVTLYLLPESNELLRPLLEKQLKPGAYVVSHNYYMPGWQAKEVNFLSLKLEDSEEHKIYVYRR